MTRLSQCYYFNRKSCPYKHPLWPNFHHWLFSLIYRTARANRGKVERGLYFTPSIGVSAQTGGLQCLGWVMYLRYYLFIFTKLALIRHSELLMVLKSMDAESGSWVQDVWGGFGFVKENKFSSSCHFNYYIYVISFHIFPKVAWMIMHVVILMHFTGFDARSESSLRSRCPRKYRRYYLLHNHTFCFWWRTELRWPSG